MNSNKSVTANFTAGTFSITPTAGANGSISPATAQTVSYGASITFTFTPATGYVVNVVTVDGATVTPVTNSYTFTNVTANHTIAVTFKQSGSLVLQTVAAATALSAVQSAAYAYDGNIGTRWESAQGVDPQWIVFDLGSAKAISVVVFDWETASAKNYTLEGSNDATFATKTTLVTETNMPSVQHRLDSLAGITGSYRYYRMYGTARSTAYGYSIWETRFYTGGNTPTNYTLSTASFGNGTVALSPAGGSYAAGTTVTLTATPATGSTFTSWTGDLTGVTNPATLVMNSNKSVTANFTGGNSMLPITGATASSNNGGNVAANVYDGNLNTRWESTQGVDPQWLYVDLGSARNISEVKIYWEAANAKNYTLEGSNDPTFATKTTLATKTNMAAGARTDDMAGLSGSYRYIRMYGTARNLAYGYSIWEFQVYGN
jgi:hypothetical protein